MREGQGREVEGETSPTVATCSPASPLPGRSMASAFSEMIKSVVRELDPRKELTPVDSLGSSANFQPYQLVLKRPSSRWFGQARYSRLNLHIMDILESCDPDSLMPPGARQSQGGGRDPSCCALALLAGPLAAA